MRANAVSNETQTIMNQSNGEGIEFENVFSSFAHVMSNHVNTTEQTTAREGKLDVLSRRIGIARWAIHGLDRNINFFGIWLNIPSTNKTDAVNEADWSKDKAYNVHGINKDTSIDVKNVNVVLNHKVKPDVRRWQIVRMASSKGDKKRSNEVGNENWYGVSEGNVQWWLDDEWSEVCKESLVSDDGCLVDVDVVMVDGEVVWTLVASMTKNQMKKVQNWEIERKCRRKRWVTWQMRLS